jgi:hypothetical protein
MPFTTEATPDFVSWLKSQVGAFAARYNLTDRHAFPPWVLTFIHDLDDQLAIDSCDTLTQGDRGVDGLYLEPDGSAVVLLQGKYPDEPLGSPISAAETRLRDLFEVYPEMCNPQSVFPNEKLQDRAITLRDALVADAAPVLELFIAGRLNDTSREEIEGTVAALDPPTSLEIFDIDRLYQAFLAIEDISDLRGETLVFDLDGAAPSPLDLEGTGVEKVAVVNLLGDSLGDVARNWIPRLFHANVRYHLQGVSANKRIAETLTNEDDARKFWLFNNGLTIVCDDFSIADDNGSVSIENPQVVNGCQTTSVIARERRMQRMQPGVKVLARIIALSAARTDLLSKISESTNTQSAVKPRDLKAHDRTQQAIKANFRAVGWHYETRRKEWTSLTAGQKANYPKGNVSNEAIAQTWQAWGGDPRQAALNPRDVWTDPTMYSDTFRAARAAHQYLLAFAVWEDFARILGRGGEDLFVRVSPWMANPNAQPHGLTFEAYMTRIRNIGSLWKAHLTHLFHQLLELSYPGNVQARAERLVDLVRSGDETLDYARNRVFLTFDRWLLTLPQNSVWRVEITKEEVAATMTRLAVQDNSDPAILEQLRAIL